MAQDSDELAGHRRRIAALCDPALYAHAVTEVVVHETHISSIVLAGEFAYKLKKPLDLGFLDFRSLAAREHYCAEELRVNARLAPALYQRVVAITADDNGLHLDGPGEVVDYAVCMVRFDQSELLGHIVEDGGLSDGLVDELADVLTRFHQQAAIASDDYGQAATVQDRALENLDSLERMSVPPRTREALDTLGPAFRERARAMAPALAERQRQGAVRECHGDLHLENLLVRDGEVMAFDAIEFAAELRWIDTASDMAFPVMDLLRRGEAAAARRLRNRYLETGGDYEALRVLPFYVAYRALVRAKVTAIQQEQSQGSPDEASLMPYLRLAQDTLVPDSPRVLVTHGLSGSGKSTVSQAWVEQAGVIRLRSDVERKRLFGLAPDAASASGLDSGIYTAQATGETYDRLAELARLVLRAGYTPLVDATFLRRAERDQLHEVARAEGADFNILALTADEATLRERLRRRAAEAGEASEADERVLDHQLRHVEALTDSERAHCLGPEPPRD
jgi:aminoglycoside phosphotransferase family enzyme/predicted kinase